LGGIKRLLYLIRQGFAKIQEIVPAIIMSCRFHLKQPQRWAQAAGDK
jgi:hypothetical protein